MKWGIHTNVRDLEITMEPALCNCVKEMGQL